MQRCPPEIWMKICALSCTDDGVTGRSLSLVSRFFHQISHPFKYQALVLSRSKQVIALNDLLLRLPPGTARIRNLFIQCPHVFLDDADEEEDEEYNDSESEGSNTDDDEGDFTADEELIGEVAELRKDIGDNIPIDIPMEEDHTSDFGKQLDSADTIVANALFSLLAIASPTLEVLTLYWVSYEGRLIEELIPFLPNLRELCLFRRFTGEDEIEPETDDRATPLFPSLERLHLAGYLETRPTQLGETLLDLAPAVRFVKVPKQDYLREPCVHLSSSVELVVLEEPTNPFRLVRRISADSKAHLEDVMMDCDRIAPKVDVTSAHLNRGRVLELKSSPVDSGDPEVWKQDWLNRVQGRGGCWCRQC